MEAQPQGSREAGALRRSAAEQRRELARRTFFALKAEEERNRGRQPTLYRVFQLYCVKNLTMRKVARKCECSIGTVFNRLKELRAKTGADPGLLRRVSPRFVEFQDDVREAARNYRRSTYHEV